MAARAFARAVGKLFPGLRIAHQQLVQRTGRAGPGRRPSVKLGEPKTHKGHDLDDLLIGNLEGRHAFVRKSATDYRADPVALLVVPHHGAPHEIGARRASVGVTPVAKTVARFAGF